MEHPTKYVPEPEYRDLPEPQPLRTYVGASVILLNRRTLPDPIKLRSWRLAGLSVAFLIYAAFVVYIIFQMITQGPGSLA